MELLKSENFDGISIITLTAGITNPINPETTDELLTTLTKISSGNTGYKGLILTSANSKFFSIGFDIPKLLLLDRAGLGAFYDAFNELCLKLYSLPMPTLTAIPGHCIGAGCIIAACTDFRFITPGKTKIGITATKLRLPVPFLADKIVRQVIKNKNADELLSTGNLYDINWAKQVGYIDEIQQTVTLFTRVKSFLKKIINQSNEEFLKAKEIKINSIRQAYYENKKEDANNFIDKWFTPKVQTQLKEATKKY